MLVHPCECLRPRAFCSSGDLLNVLLSLGLGMADVCSSIAFC